jgi:hypothetical protein
MVVPAGWSVVMDEPTYSLWEDRTSGQLWVAQQSGFSGLWRWFGPTSRDEAVVQEVFALQERALRDE